MVWGLTFGKGRKWEPSSIDRATAMRMSERRPRVHGHQLPDPRNRQCLICESPALGRPPVPAAWPAQWPGLRSTPRLHDPREIGAPEVRLGGLAADLGVLQPHRQVVLVTKDTNLRLKAKAEKKPAKKVAKKVAGGKGKKGKSKVESFKIYIYKVLKQVRQLTLARHATCWDLLRCDPVCWRSSAFSFYSFGFLRDMHLCTVASDSAPCFDLGLTLLV